MPISNESKDVLRAKLASLKDAKNEINVQIDIKNAEKDELVARRNAINQQIQSLQNDLA